MKKIIYYILIMIVVTILLPFLIVRGCNTVMEDVKPKEKAVKPETKITVYIKATDEVKEMTLESYIKGVLAAEMPVAFENEALKAQAVAARTYAYSRMLNLYPAKEDKHKGAQVCTDWEHCQSWISKEDIFKKWGSLKAAENWKKIEGAVKATENIIIFYDNKPINPLFHSNSGGRTENIEDVWEGNGVPYLKSVKSDGEDEDAGYKVVTTFKEKDIIDKLKTKYADIKLNESDLISNFTILELSEGGRVKTMKVGDMELKGTDFRQLLSLRSTNFKFEKGKEGEINITTIGYGHGVGMSQYGANYLAKNGGTFEEILKHYYKGVSLGSISN
jgi:stage II sporulation protein D